jgi:hypothetical protein
MLDYLQPIKNADVDFIMFFQGSLPDSIKVDGSQYEDRGTPIGGNELGHVYHIMLCRDHPEDKNKFDKFDHFEAVLVCPLEYISGLITQGWYGIVAKKTTTSEKVYNRIVDLMTKHLYN